MRIVVLTALLCAGCGSKFTTNATPVPASACAAAKAGEVEFSPNKPPELAGVPCK